MTQSRVTGWICHARTAVVDAPRFTRIALADHAAAAPEMPYGGIRATFSARFTVNPATLISMRAFVRPPITRTIIVGPATALTHTPTAAMESAVAPVRKS